MKKVKNTFWGMVLSLTLICLIFTGLLAVVYAVTLEPIELSQIKKQQEAIKAVQGEFTEMKADTAAVALPDGSEARYPVFVTYNDTVLNGVAVECTNNGFGGEFKIMAGFDAAGRLVDYSVLSHAETPGLGSKMDVWFKDALKGRSLDASKPLTVSKDGGDVDAITAATITSRAFLTAINNAYLAYLKVIENK